ncbi:MAG TPA: ISAs1 family transposase [Bacteroidales bacterium]|nr:ISAs1 family transposase [Bacteroidales bacterium]
MKSPIEYFTEITDPRIERCKEHLLSDIIFITISAVICGCETWNDIESYGESKETWLRRFLKLPNGIPSHDTFNRVFSALDPQQMEDCFLNWIKAIAEITEGEVVSIDGKTIRGSRSKGAKSFVHMVSAWANTNHLLLGQVKVDDKSNEITAIPKLLEVLELTGCIVTIDAMGCQTEIADKIISKGADYLLAVKGNQGKLEEGIQDVVLFAKPVDEYNDTDFGHGRIEQRKCQVYSDLTHIQDVPRWKELRTIVKIEATRTIKSTNKVETETRFYISSLKPDAKRISEAVRKHWGIENSLHWVLDVSFGEDKSMKHNANAVENFSIINRIALNLVKQEKSKKRSVKGKRLDAGWDNDYLLKILKN